jgi:hypothetical protein
MHTYHVPHASVVSHTTPLTQFWKFRILDSIELHHCQRVVGESVFTSLARELLWWGMNELLDGYSEYVKALVEGCELYRISSAGASN